MSVVFHPEHLCKRPKTVNDLETKGSRFVKHIVLLSLLLIQLVWLREEFYRAKTGSKLVRQPHDSMTLLNLLSERHVTYINAF